MRPNLSIFGWYILVKKRTFGGPIGYSPGKNNSKRNRPPTDVQDYEAEYWVNELRPFEYNESTSRRK